MMNDNNCVDFVKSINCNDQEKEFKEFFDQFMLMYDLIGYRSDIDIYTNVKDTNISFLLISEDKRSIARLKEYIDSCRLTCRIYNRTFSCKIVKKTESEYEVYLTEII